MLLHGTIFHATLHLCLELSKETYWLHSKPISEASKYMISLQTPSFGWSFQDGRQLASKPVHQNDELLDPVLFFRSVDPIRTLGGTAYSQASQNRT